jgi:hypothetical protein
MTRFSKWAAGKTSPIGAAAPPQGGYYELIFASGTTDETKAGFIWPRIFATAFTDRPVMDLHPDVLLE